MAENKPYTFVLSDESINESGFRVLTSGIDVSQFKKNPIVLYEHYRANWNKPQLLPIGICVNIRKEDGRLLADIEFDMDDEFAVKIAKKVEKKHLRATSIGIKVVEVSSAPKHLIKGQTRPSVTKSRMLELSVVTIPRNGNALRLSIGELSDGEYLELGADGSYEELNKILPLIESQNSMSITKNTLVFQALSLPETSTELDAVKAITKLSTQLEALTSENEALETKIKGLEDSALDAKCSLLINQAVKEKKITEAQRSVWLKMSKDNYEQTKEALDGMEGFKTLRGEIEDTKTVDTTLSDAQKFDKMWENGKLEEWKKNNAEEYQRCYDAYHEVDC